jgi:hypothetical protein
MSARQSLNADRIIEHYRTENENLRLINKQLNDKLKTMESMGRRPSQTWAAALYRSQQHRRNLRTLQSAYIWVWIGWFLWACVSLLMTISMFAIYTRYYAKTYPIINDYIVNYPAWLVNPKVISVTAGCLGIIISIIGQRIFPAPWRTFCAVGAIAIKQIAGIFLPEWCTLFLILFSSMAIYVLQVDKNEQVSSV